MNSINFRFVLTFSAIAGGFRKLRNRDTAQIYPSQNYSEKTTSKIIEFRFDFESPIHCIEDITPCTEQQPLHISEDITQVINTDICTILKTIHNSVLKKFNNDLIYISRIDL